MCKLVVPQYAVKNVCVKTRRVSRHKEWHWGKKISSDGWVPITCVVSPLPSDSLVHVLRVIFDCRSYVRECGEVCFLLIADRSFWSCELR